MTVFPTSPLIDRLIDLALEEDLGLGDVTTQALIPPDLQGEAHLRAKQNLVVAGLPVAALVFQKVDATLVFEPQAEEGQEVARARCWPASPGRWPPSSPASAPPSISSSASPASPPLPGKW